MLPVSRLIVLGSNQEIIASANYRNDVNDAIVEAFMQNLKSSEKRNLQPHVVCDGMNFYFIKRNRVYFVACSASELFPVMVIELLTRLYHICKDFCGVVSDESLQTNLLLLHELLEEFMNEGYVQLDSSEKIQPYIQSTPVTMQKEKSPTTQMSSRMFGIETKLLHGSSSSWTVSCLPGEMEKSGFYVDVIEKMVAVIAADGTVSHIEVDGSLVVRNFLTGSSRFKMFLNEDLRIVDPNLKGYGTQVQLDRCSFHDCVNHDEFLSKQYLVLAPPVGEFAAMTYTASGHLCLKQPFILRTFVNEVQGSRDLKVTLRLKGNFPPNIYASKVKVNIPVPKSVISVSTKLSSEIDTADFSKEDGNITWSMKKLPGETECIGEFRVNSLKKKSLEEKTPNRPTEFKLPRSPIKVSQPTQKPGHLEQKNSTQLFTTGFVEIFDAFPLLSSIRPDTDKVLESLPKDIKENVATEVPVRKVAIAAPVKTSTPNRTPNSGPNFDFDLSSVKEDTDEDELLCFNASGNEVNSSELIDLSNIFIAPEQECLSDKNVKDGCAVRSPLLAKPMNRRQKMQKSKNLKRKFPAKHVEKKVPETKTRVNTQKTLPSRNQFSVRERETAKSKRKIKSVRAGLQRKLSNEKAAACFRNENKSDISRICHKLGIKYYNKDVLGICPLTYSLSKCEKVAVTLFSYKEPQQMPECGYIPKDNLP